MVDDPRRTTTIICTICAMAPAVTGLRYGDGSQVPDEYLCAGCSDRTEEPNPSGVTVLTVAPPEGGAGFYEDREKGEDDD
jgi:hypothetical protein